MSSAVSDRPPGGQPRYPELTSAKEVPKAGGLYAYARYEFGDFAGYLTGWCYWVQAWAGNAAIVSSWVFYCDALPAGINLAGIRQTARLQNLTVVLKYLPLLFVAVVGWFFVSKANFGAFNASGGSLYSAIGIAAGVALFSFIGVETAAITAKRGAQGRPEAAAFPEPQLGDAARRRLPAAPATQPSLLPGQLRLGLRRGSP